MKNTEDGKKFRFPNSDDEEKYKFMKEIPPRNARYIVLDTETTGLTKDDHIIEIGAVEVKNGKVSGAQFHIFLKPRKPMSNEIVNIHHISNEFHNENWSSFYLDEKGNLENFISFIGDSLIFCHNAPFDMTFLNRELSHYHITRIKEKKFRCTMRIFHEIVSKVDKFVVNYKSVENCCKYLRIKYEVDKFHSALYDATMTAKILCNLYDFIETHNLSTALNCNLSIEQSFNGININGLNSVKNFANRNKTKTGQFSTSSSENSESGEQTNLSNRLRHDYSSNSQKNLVNGNGKSNQNIIKGIRQKANKNTMMMNNLFKADKENDSNPAIKDSIPMKKEFKKNNNPERINRKSVKVLKPEKDQTKITDFAPIKSKRSKSVNVSTK